MKIKLSKSELTQITLDEEAHFIKIADISRFCELADNNKVEIAMRLDRNGERGLYISRGGTAAW